MSGETPLRVILVSSAVCSCLLLYHLRLWFVAASAAAVGVLLLAAVASAALGGGGRQGVASSSHMELPCYLLSGWIAYGALYCGTGLAMDGLASALCTLLVLSGVLLAQILRRRTSTDALVARAGSALALVSVILLPNAWNLPGLISTELFALHLVVMVALFLLVTCAPIFWDRPSETAKAGSTQGLDGASLDLGWTLFVHHYALPLAVLQVVLIHARPRGEPWWGCLVGPSDARTILPLHEPEAPRHPLEANRPPLSWGSLQALRGRGCQSARTKR
jgi:hypothetical protein